MTTEPIDRNARDLVAFVTTDLVSMWKSWSEGASYRGAAPYVYGSNSSVFNVRARRGAVLWIIGRLPISDAPTLMAKITIKGRSDLGDSLAFDEPRDRELFEETLKAYERIYCYVAFGTENSSRFFPFNCATVALLKTVFGLREQRLWTVADGVRERPPFRWQKSFGSRFRRPAIIAKPSFKYRGKRAPGSRHLRQLEKQAQTAVFLSWKHDDLSDVTPLKRDAIESFVQSLALRRVMCWFDLFSLPNYRTEEEEGELARLLAQGYRSCRRFVAIASPNYGEPSNDCNWTLDEWEGLGEKPLKPIVWNPLGIELNKTIFARVPAKDRIESPDAKRAAKQVAMMLKSEVLPSR